LARSRRRQVTSDMGPAAAKDCSRPALSLVPPVQLIHSIPGRIRVHISEWGNCEVDGLERRVRALPGIRAVVANPVTQNVLIRFDPLLTTTEAVLARVRSETSLTSTTARCRPRKLRASGRPSTGAAVRGMTLVRTARAGFQLRPFAILPHAPALLSLVLSLLTCTSPLGLVRVALEALQLCGELSGPAPA
jgi:hypothetical protein